MSDFALNARLRFARGSSGSGAERTIEGAWWRSMLASILTIVDPVWAQALLHYKESVEFEMEWPTAEGQTASGAVTVLPWTTSDGEAGTTPAEQGAAAIPSKNAAAIRLLDEWLADESGYDERAWPIAKSALEAARLGTRRLFRD